MAHPIQVGLCETMQQKNKKEQEMIHRRMYRQGDLLLVEVKELPAGARPRKTAVIIEGEATGHTHQIVSGTIYDTATAAFVVAQEGARLAHDEHGPIVIPKGIYSVTRQREYAPTRKSTKPGPAKKSFKPVVD
jgi:hypothetical protein